MGLDPVSIASAGIGVGGAIYGAVKAGQERKRMEQFLAAQEADNTARYNKDYYSDYTQRADTQALMKRLRENLQRSNTITNKTAAVTGATSEAVNVQKDQNNKVVTDTMSNVAAMGQKWKDRVQDRYLAMKNNYANMRYGNMAGNAASYENLMVNGIGAMGSAVNGIANGYMTPTTANADNAILNNINAMSKGVNMGKLETPKTGVNVSGGINPNNIKLKTSK